MSKTYLEETDDESAESEQLTEAQILDAKIPEAMRASMDIFDSAENDSRIHHKRHAKLIKRKSISESAKKPKFQINEELRQEILTREQENDDIKELDFGEQLTLAQENNFNTQLYEAEHQDESAKIELAPDKSYDEMAEDAKLDKIYPRAYTITTKQTSTPEYRRKLGLSKSTINRRAYAEPLARASRQVDVMSSYAKMNLIIASIFCVVFITTFLTFNFCGLYAHKLFAIRILSNIITALTALPVFFLYIYPPLVIGKEELAGDYYHLYIIIMQLPTTFMRLLFVAAASRTNILIYIPVIFIIYNITSYYYYRDLSQYRITYQPSQTALAIVFTLIGLALMTVLPNPLMHTKNLELLYNFLAPFIVLLIFIDWRIGAVFFKDV